MTWIYLSPHFDDAAYSCGGLIWEQAQTGENPEIWTVFSAPPDNQDLTPFAKSLHERWQVPVDGAVRTRQHEDRAALQILGARGRGLGIPECIYRQLPDGSPLINREEDLWQAIPPGELPLVGNLGKILAKRVPTEANLICPYGLGNHVDHRIVRAASEEAFTHIKDCQLWYYADFPYAMRGHLGDLNQDLVETTFTVTEPGLTAWQQAVAAYASQFSSFWQNDEDMKADVTQFRDRMGGVRLLCKA